MTNWLLLRGLARESRHWHGFERFLETNLSPETRLHLLDLPGTGSRHSERSPRTVSEITDRVRANWLPLREKHPQPWGILGISLGGMITLDWCDRFVDDFERAVVVNTSAAGVGSIFYRIRPSTLPEFASLFFTTSIRKRERAILKMTSNLKGNHLEEILSKNVAYAEERPISRTTALRQLQAAVRFRIPQKMKVPTLVLASKGDRLVNHQISKAIAEHLGVSIQLHPSAGHDLPLDAPDWLACKLRQRPQSADLP